MKRDKPIVCKDTGEVFWYYKSYLYSKHWYIFKKRALKHYGKRCLICGAKQNLNVHHLTYDRVGNELLSDVQILCRFHHKMAHAMPIYNPIRKRVGWVFWLIVGSIIYAMWRYDG